MKTLTYNQIMAEATNCGNGRIIRVGYQKELNMLSNWQQLGYRAVKLTETSVRLGVKYANIKAVKERISKTAPKATKTDNWSWIIPNKVKYNSNTGGTYLQVATLNGGHNTRSQYLVYDPKVGWFVLEKPEWEMSEYYRMVDYKSRGSSNKPDVMTINFSNIYKLGSLLA